MRLRLITDQILVLGAYASLTLLYLVLDISTPFPVVLNLVLLLIIMPQMPSHSPPPYSLEGSSLSSSASVDSDARAFMRAFESAREPTRWALRTFAFTFMAAIFTPFFVS